MRRGLAGTTAATLLGADRTHRRAALRRPRSPAKSLDFQFLMLALALTGLFLGVSVDERRSRGDEAARQAGRTRPEPARGGRERARVHARARAQPAAVGDRHLHAVRADPARTRRPRRRAAGDDAQGRRGGEPGRHGDAPAARVRAAPDRSRLEPLRRGDAAGGRGWPPRWRARSSTTCCCRPCAAPDLPAVLGDRIPLETVLHNLIANAIDAVKGQRPAAASCAVTAVRHDASTVRICGGRRGTRRRGRDGGDAVRAARHEQGARAWAWAYRSAGRSSRRTAAGCGWTRPSRGASFLPYASDCPPDPGRTSDSPMPSRITVHVVDDDDAVRDSLCLLLRLHGYVPRPHAVRRRLPRRDRRCALVGDRAARPADARNGRRRRAGGARASATCAGRSSC